MFNSSIEVLQCLVVEYEKKFGILSKEIRNDDIGELLFENFYNRLRVML